MSRTYELVRKIVQEQKYKVVDDDGENLVINYQMNAIFIFVTMGVENFVSMVLPDFADVTEENFSEVVMNCHDLNAKELQVKYYTMEGRVVVSSEFYFLGKKDLLFQMKMALHNLIEAKVSYQRIDGAWLPQRDSFK